MLRRLARGALIVAIGAAATVTAQEVSDRLAEAVPPDPLPLPPEALPPLTPPEPRPSPPRRPSRGGPNPYVVVGAAFVVGFAVGKLLDRRSRGDASG
jgi:hypothetical protein